MFHDTQTVLRGLGRWHDELDVPACERYARAVTTARELRAQADELTGDDRLRVLALALQADRDAGQYARDLAVTPERRLPRPQRRERQPTEREEPAAPRVAATERKEYHF